MSKPASSDTLRPVAEALQAGKLQAAAAALQELIGLVPDVVELGRDLGRLLAGLYDDFRISEVLAFAAWLERHPAEEMAQPALQAIAPRLEAIKEWQKLLNDIAAERLSRDLAAQVQMRDIGAATETAKRIIGQAKSLEGRTRQARQIGAVLGALNHDQERADQVIRGLARDMRSIGMEESQLRALEDTRRVTFTNQAGSGFGQQGRAWTQLHTEAVVQLMRSLPGGMAGSQATDEGEDKFYAALHQMLAAYYADQNSLDFLDVARILHEFCPTDPRATGPVEGIEEIAFLRMNPVDKVVSVRCLRRLGEKEKIVDSVFECAKNYKDGKPAEIMLSVMGGLSNARFFPSLSSALRDKRYVRMIPAIIDSLGRIGDPQSLSTLQAMYEQYCRAKMIDPPMQRVLANLIAALGRISRSPRTSNDARSAIVLRALKFLPDDRPLTEQALHHFFSLYDPASLSHEVKSIGIQYIVDGLWTPDTRSKLAKGSENQRTELGHREELVNILVQMGSDCLPILLQESERRAMQYSGAYWALGEALSEIGDERALPFLQKILMNTLVTDDSKIPEQMREVYFDAAKGENVPLSRDRIAHSLLYAIQKRCGNSGSRVLMDLAKAIQNRRYSAPGSQSAGLLQEVLMQDRLRSEAQKRGEVALEEQPEDFGDNLDALLPKEEKRPRQDEPLEKLVKDIRGKGLFGVKADKRISAIHEVAARRSQEAIEALCELLDGSDKMIRAAAEVALLEIVGPAAATANATASGLVVYEALEALRKASGERAEAVSALLAKIGPERDPLRMVLLRFVETEADPKMKAKIARVYQLAQLQNPNGMISGEAETGSDVSGDGATDSGGQGSAMQGGARIVTEHEKIALRRKYYAERQAWIAGGKKGPEPPRPSGI